MVNTNTPLPEQIAKLEQRLQILEQKRLIAGADLRVTEITETLLLIERIPDNTDQEILSSRLEKAEERLDDIFRSDWIAGSGLIARNNGLQKILEIDPAFLNNSQPQRVTETGQNDFPFRVRLAGSQPAEGNGKNFLLCAGGNELPEALVYAGTAEPFRVEKHIFQTDCDCCIFLRIVLDPEPTETSPGSLRLSVEQDSTFPMPTKTQYIVPIAKIIFNTPGITIQQMQFGNIFLAGRVI